LKEGQQERLVGQEKGGEGGGFLKGLRFRWRKRNQREHYNLVRSTSWPSWAYSQPTNTT